MIEGDLIGRRVAAALIGGIVVFRPRDRRQRLGDLMAAPAVVRG